MRRLPSILPLVVVLPATGAAGEQPREVPVLRGNSEAAFHLAFSSDAKLLASCGEPRVKVWTLETRKEPCELRGSRSRPGSASHSIRTGPQVPGLQVGQRGHADVGPDSDGQSDHAWAKRRCDGGAGLFRKTAESSCTPPPPHPAPLPRHAERPLRFGKWRCESNSTCCSGARGPPARSPLAPITSPWRLNSFLRSRQSSRCNTFYRLYIRIRSRDRTHII
jgi:hypothetical protein